ncbi:MAG: aconitate hydratase AcnA [Deltaproteobacteria bacterium]|nr:aconitate hydratase AcnA [Deltaproteobacteria bacterium]
MQETDFKDSFGALTALEVGGAQGRYFRLAALREQGVGDVDRLPFSVKVLLESVMRAEDGRFVSREDVAALAAYDPVDPPRIEVPFKPARVLLQDFTGVPAVVDLAAMRSAMTRLGGNPALVNPQIPVDLVVDHSVQVDSFASPDALARNAELEFERNRERYEFLHWAQATFDDFRVVPPASGICHQVNLEYLGRVVRSVAMDDGTLLFTPDSLVGTDSHTPMIAGLGVLGWGVGGIEAEAVMLGQPLYMIAPPVVGVKLEGRMPDGSTATDLVLVVTELLRAHGVVGKFVEFFGRGLAELTVPDRATIANMSPEYGATVGFFPVDEQSLAYLGDTGRPDDLVELVRTYCTAQGLFRDNDTPDPEFETTLTLDLASVRTALAGPKRPQDRVVLSEMKRAFAESMAAPRGPRGFGVPKGGRGATVEVDIPGAGVHELAHGHVAIAAITSCTNTSNPSVMVAAGLLAKKAVERGLTSKPWVKTSLAPGSTVVTEYLNGSGLLPYLEQLGFHVVGYGCTTCIGNSGPLPEPISGAVTDADLVVAAVLSGNRNFEGRINPLVRASYLASPPLVVAYAIAGTVDIDLGSEPLGTDPAGRAVLLADIWPGADEIADYISRSLGPETFTERYAGIEQQNPTWNAIAASGGVIYDWDEVSDYIREPPYFDEMELVPRPIEPIKDARVLVLVGDSITTDHISPAGTIPEDSSAGQYLVGRGVAPIHFNSYGSRRGNDRVMTRGTFANIRLKNRLAPGTEGGWTTHLPSREVVTIFEAAERYEAAGTATVVIGGVDYGMGSSRDWAAKGTLLLGVRAVIAESFERIHRSNLVGMGVLPLQFAPGQSAASHGLDGSETYHVHVGDDVSPADTIRVEAVSADGKVEEIDVVCRLDTPVDVEYYRGGGILQCVLRRLMQ